MNLVKASTLALALALTGWVACGSSNNNTDVLNINTGGTGGTAVTGGRSGTGGALGSGGAGGMGGAMADAGTPDAPAPGVFDAGMDAPPSEVGRVDAPAPIGDVAPGDGGVDICTGLTPEQCHLAIINAAVDPTVSALDPGANPPVLYPACAAQ